MESLREVEGRAIPYGAKNVDTDVIIPAHWLKTITREGLGRVLLRASAGRYYRGVALDIATREFARRPSGNNEFDQFAWNPSTGLYDRFQQHVAPVLDAEPAPARLH